MKNDFKFKMKCNAQLSTVFLAFTFSTLIRIKYLNHEIFRQKSFDWNHEVFFMDLHVLKCLEHDSRDFGRSLFVCAWYKFCGFSNSILRKTPRRAISLHRPRSHMQTIGLIPTTISNSITAAQNFINLKI